MNAFNKMKSPSAIQKFYEEDLNQALSLEKSSYLTPWSKESFISAIRNPNGVNLVYKVQDEVIGYITSFMVLDEVYITNLLVAPEHRENGIGRALLSHLIEKIKQKKGFHIILEVREGNVGAINFYKKMGFQFIGSRKKYYSDTNEDALVMKISFESG